MNVVDKAMAIAIKYHEGQRSAHSPEPYALHPMRVWVATRNGGLDETHQAVAWLHDTLEDTDYSPLQMEKDFGDVILDAVVAMTKVKGEPNEVYYRRVYRNLIARRVKIHDINENFGRNHLIEDDATRLRMAKKYSLGLDILTRTHL